jgi:hypothetical protein
VKIWGGVREPQEGCLWPRQSSMNLCGSVSGKEWFWGSFGWRFTDYDRRRNLGLRSGFDGRLGRCLVGGGWRAWWGGLSRRLCGCIRRFYRGSHGEGRGRGIALENS